MPHREFASGTLDGGWFAPKRDSQYGFATKALTVFLVSNYDAFLDAAADERCWNLNFSKLFKATDVGLTYRLSPELLDASLHTLVDELSRKTARAGDEQVRADPETAEAEAENLERIFEWRINLLRDAWSTPDVSERLGITPQAIRKRIKQKQLLGIKHAGDYRFPRWQFDPHTELGVIRGFSGVPSRRHASSRSRSRLG